MNKPTHYITQGQANFFCCSQCSNQLLRTAIVGTTLFVECTICQTYNCYPFPELSKGSFEPSNTDIVVKAPEQELAVSVPATAPAAGHLSTETHPDLPVLQEPCECSKCKSSHGILNVYAHGLVTVGCPDCWNSDQSLISVMAEIFFSQLSTKSVNN